MPWASTLNPRTPQSALAGLGTSRPFILTVAVIENRKNLLQLAQALEGNTALDWVILGKTGFGGEEILARLRTLCPRLIHLADVSEGELAWAYRNAAALVLPSLEEGFGLPVLEAAQFGTRLVLSKIPAFSDITAACPIPTALFFDSDESLREIIAELSSQNLKAPDPTPLARHYSWERTARGFATIYREVSPDGFPAP